MKKSFRNKLIATCAAASMSFLLLSGFDSSLTVDDVMQNMTASMSLQGGMNCEMHGTADVSVDVTAGGETQSLPLTGSLDYSILMTMDPFVMYIAGEAQGDASAMGITGDFGFETYMEEQEDGTGIMYMSLKQGDDTGWHAASLPAEYMETVLGSVKAAFSGDTEAASAAAGLDLTEIQEMLGGNAQLAPEPVNVNGVDCYEITHSIDGNTLYSIVSKVLEAMPQAGIDTSSLAAFQMLFSGIRMDMVTDCKVEDFTPVYAAVDLSGSDFGMIAQMFGAMTGMTGDASQAPQIDVKVNALNLSMNYDAAPAEIEIPEDALAAEIETSLSMEDLTAAAQAAQ